MFSTARPGLLSRNAFAVFRRPLRPNGSTPRVATLPSAEAGNIAGSNVWFPTFGAELTEHDIARGDVDKESVEDCPEGYWVKKVEGEIPADLCGTYFRNGPGEFSFLNEPVPFPFDANGIIGSIAIRDGKAFFRSRFVRTEHSMLEEKAGRRLFTGVFGSKPANGALPFTRFLPRNSGNGKPVITAGKLFVPQEGTTLTELDPHTLETVYPRLEGDFFSSALRLGAQQLFFAGLNLNGGRRKNDADPGYLDPRSVVGLGDSSKDARRGVSVWPLSQPKPSFSPGFLDTSIKICEVGDDLKLHNEQTYSLDGFSLVHSVGVSENYYIINKFPMELSMKRILDPSISIGNTLVWDDNGVHEFHLLPRPSRNGDAQKHAAPRIYKLEETTFAFHFINAFEDGDNVIVDATHYPSYLLGPFAEKGESVFEFYDPVNGLTPRWRRTTCYPDGRAETREMTPRAVEHCTLNPRYVGQPYRYSYMLAGLHPTEYRTIQALAKVDLETGDTELWTKGQHYFVGEPQFVPKPGGTEEEDGWIVALCYNGLTQKTDFVILDAARIEEGPVAILYLEQALGIGLHGTWAEAYYGP